MRKIIPIILSLVLFVNALPLSALDVSAKSAIVIEAASKNVVFERDADTRRPMASTTKIMSALVAINSGDLSREVCVDERAVGVEGSSIYLKAGDKLTLLDLVYALMLESANDAAEAIAYELGGSIEGFAALMNQTATELGLSDTHFANPHGLSSDEHYTTARELALIAAHALENETFAKIAATKSHTINVGQTTKTLHNHNKMLSLYEDSIGVKTGFTKASGRCLVSAAKRDGLTFVAVTLDAPDDWRDHSAMLDLGFERLESLCLIQPWEAAILVPVFGGNAADVVVRNREGLTLILPKTERSISHTIELPRQLWAPVQSGAKVGRIVFKDGEDVIGEVALYAEMGTERVQYKKNILEKIFNK